MGIIIDAFNLMYKIPDLQAKMEAEQLAPARKGLVELLNKYWAIKPADICLVIDGKRGHGDLLESETIGKIKLVYSLDRKADDIIMAMIKADANPKMTTVVTSDNAIIVYAKRRQARVVKSEDFTEHIRKTIGEHEARREAEKDMDPQMSPEEVADWMEYFKREKK